MDIGKSLKQAMLDNDTKGYDLSEHMGLSGSTISLIRNNRRSTTFDNLEKFAEFFGMSVSEFIELGES
jgi:DNA-binding Xre family transcriptional regulator